MFGIGSTELLVILVVALIALGPKSLAGVAKSLGKAVGEFRRVSTDFQRAINVEAAADDAREAARKRAAAQKAENSSTPQDPTNYADLNLANKESGNKAAPPDDSPLARALAKARTQANSSSSPGDGQING